MNILLVYPENPYGFWTFDQILRKYSRYKSISAPLGLLTVAAMLPKDWNLKLINMNCQKLHDKDIRWADYVFISAINLQRDAVRGVVDRCKSFGVKTVGGGPLFTYDHDHFDDIDHLLLFEGEVCVPKFLADLDNHTPKHIYGWEEYPDLALSPIPKWDLINVHHYSRLNLQYSRGCPHNCDFCAIGKLFGCKTRTKDTSQIIAEIEAIYATGWKGCLFFVDDSFISNKKKLKEDMLPSLIEWQQAHDYPFSFLTQTSMYLADDEELMNLMSDAGFKEVFLGIESPDPDSLAEVHKNPNLKRDLVDSVKRIQQHGMQVMGGFILGFDNDKPAIFDHMIQYIQESGIVMAMVGLLVAPFGSKLYDKLKEEGRLLQDFPDGGTNIITKMDLNVLYEGYRKVVHTIYSPKIFYQRVKIFLENYQPKKQNKKTKKPDFKEIISFFKVCLHLGIIHGGRIDYWKLIIWSSPKGSHVFNLSISLAVFGYHMRKYLPKEGIPDSIGW